jgi:hypothetical protein
MEGPAANGAVRSGSQSVSIDVVVTKWLAQYPTESSQQEANKILNTFKSNWISTVGHWAHIPEVRYCPITSFKITEINIGVGTEGHNASSAFPSKMLWWRASARDVRRAKHLKRTRRHICLQFEGKKAFLGLCLLLIIGLRLLQTLLQSWTIIYMIIAILYQVSRRCFSPGRNKTTSSVRPIDSISCINDSIWSYNCILKK